MSAVYHTQPFGGAGLRRALGRLAAIRKRRLQRRAARELAELPPYLLRDVGLVDVSPPPEDGGRTLDHTAMRQTPPACRW